MYSKRIVAFIDLLGFKNSVSSKDFSYVENIINEFSKMMKKADEHHTSSLAYAHIAEKKYNKKIIKFDENKQNLTFFSDCVVWSYPLDEIKVDGIFSLIALTSSFKILQTVLMGKGILIRGGVTFGDIYHQNNKIFGQAMVRAYELEKKAKYPRIVFDIKFLDLCNIKHLELINHEVTYSLNKDFFILDMFKYIKSVNKRLIDNAEDKIHEVTKSILQHLVDNLCIAIKSGEGESEPGVRMKYDWMKTKLKAIDNLQVSVSVAL